MISKRLITTFESNSSTWWLQIKYNKLALPKNLFKQKKKKEEEDYKPHDHPHHHHHYRKQKQQFMCIERNIKHKVCYEIDGKTATLQSNGVGSFSFWQNRFCL